ncbi:MAG TPA: acetylglutamate kinase [Candidatus Aphodovivens excrementavium]|nr:acetylglutamate kinase [Candidatus Aphodovivens excrementavium]
MNYDKETRPNGVPSLTAEVLAEAMPWIKNCTGKTIVIKYGGAAMVDEKLRADVMADIVLLKIIGMNPVIVHGGGKAITAAMQRHQLEVKFVDGQRVTTDEAMELVRTVLTGKVNQELVAAINIHGNLAVGVSGADAGTIIASQADPRLGRVGKVECINSQLLEDMVASDFIPVLATVGIDEEGGFYNVNADVVAGHVAAAIGAHKIVFLTDVDGLYEDFSNKDSLVSRMTLQEAKDLVESGTLSSGMVPKMRSCVHAMEAGVHRAHIINGTTPHALLLELLTDKGIGTMVDQQKDPEAFEKKPLGVFASRLAVNH